MPNSKSAYSFSNKKEKFDTHIIVVWVDNEAGVLARVVGLFSGRGYNIESLAVAQVDEKLKISRITIVTTGTPQVVNQIKLQLRKLVPIHKVADFKREDKAVIFKEMALFKIVGSNYKFQPVLVTDVAQSIYRAIKEKNNSGKTYEIGGPKIYSFKEMISLILKTIGKKRLIFDMPMQIAKIQSSILSILPIPPILTNDQCIILSEADNVVSQNSLTANDLKLKTNDIETEMKKWLWRFRSGGEFSEVK